MNWDASWGKPLCLNTHFSQSVMNYEHIHPPITPWKLRYEVQNCNVNMYSHVEGRLCKVTKKVYNLPFIFVVLHPPRLPHSVWTVFLVDFIPSLLSGRGKAAARVPVKSPKKLTSCPSFSWFCIPTGSRTRSEPCAVPFLPIWLWKSDWGMGKQHTAKNCVLGLSVFLFLVAFLPQMPKMAVKHMDNYI